MTWLLWLKTNKALLGKISAVLGAVLVLYQIHDHIRQNAIRDCQTSAQAALNAKVDELRKQYEKKVQDALDLQSLEHQEDLIRVRGEVVIKERTKVVTEYVDRIKEIPAECDSLMLDVGRVLSDSTNTVISAGTGGAGS